MQAALEVFTEKSRGMEKSDLCCARVLQRSRTNRVHMCIFGLHNPVSQNL